MEWSQEEGEIRRREGKYGRVESYLVLVNF
jgi:hypothetical protein